MTWVVIVAVALGSFAFRLGPLLVLERVSLSERGDRVIRYAGTSAITALIVVSIRQSATGSALVPTLLAVAVAIPLAIRGASMLLLLVIGAAIYAGAVIATGFLAR